MRRLEQEIRKANVLGNQLAVDRLCDARIKCSTSQPLLACELEGLEQLVSPVYWHILGLPKPHLQKYQRMLERQLLLAIGPALEHSHFSKNVIGRSKTLRHIETWKQFYQGKGSALIRSVYLGFPENREGLENRRVSIATQFYSYFRGMIHSMKVYLERWFKKERKAQASRGKLLLKQLQARAERCRP